MGCQPVSLPVAGHIQSINYQRYDRWSIQGHRRRAAIQVNNIASVPVTECNRSYNKLIKKTSTMTSTRRGKANKFNTNIIKLPNHKKATCLDIVEPSLRLLPNNTEL